MHYHLPPQQRCPKSTQFWENSTTQTLRRQRGSRFPFVQIQMSEIQVKWLSHTPLPIPFIIYLFIGSLVCKGGRESQYILLRKAWVSRWKTRTTAAEERVRGWDVATGLQRAGKCLPVNTRHLHRKAAQVPGTEKIKDLAEKSSVNMPPWSIYMFCQLFLLQ